MSDQPTSAKGFWQTVPGILTGLAAVLTAIGGLFAVLLQIGIIGGSDNTPPPGPVANAQSTRPGAASTPTTANAAAPGGWANATAVMTANDGKEYTSRAETFRFCISAGAGIYFNNAQDIAFEKMTLLEVLRSDVALSAGGKADIRITLTTGTVLTGTMDAGCDFIMQAEAGRVNLYPDKVKKIEFKRSQP